VAWVWVRFLTKLRVSSRVEAATGAALAAHAVEDVGRRSDLFPVRVGVHTGPAVMRGCDWYGGAVNVAARLARQAEPNEALVSAATRAAVRALGIWRTLLVAPGQIRPLLKRRPSRLAR
jgi:class 3 adenylate cyclase